MEIKEEKVSCYCNECGYTSYEDEFLELDPSDTICPKCGCRDIGYEL